MNSTPARLARSGSGGAKVGFIVQLTWLDFVRRKDLYVVAVLMLLYVIAAVTIRIIGIANTDVARFLMSAGLTLSHFLAAFLAASFCARAFPEELDRRTLVPLLAKPVSRSQVLAGKAIGCLSLVLAGYLLFVGMTLLCTPVVEGQRWSALVQATVLQMTGLALLGMLAMAISLYLPTIVAALAALVWYFASGFALNAMAGWAATHGPAAKAWTERVTACLPDAKLLSHTECFANSSVRLDWQLFLALLLYGLGWTAALALWARLRFERIRL